MKGGPVAPFLCSPFSVNKTTRLLSVFLSRIQEKSAGKENTGCLAATLQTSAPGDLRLPQ